MVENLLNEGFFGRLQLLDGLGFDLNAALFLCAFPIDLIVLADQVDVYALLVVVELDMHEEYARVWIEYEQVRQDLLLSLMMLEHSPVLAVVEE